VSLGPRRISDDDRGEALAGQVRQVVRCNRLDRLAGVAARGARSGCHQDGSGNEDLLECGRPGKHLVGDVRVLCPFNCGNPLQALQQRIEVC
jgi:hypothetical protein